MGAFDMLSECLSLGGRRVGWEWHLADRTAGRAHVVDQFRKSAQWQQFEDDLLTVAESHISKRGFSAPRNAIDHSKSQRVKKENGAGRPRSVLLAARQEVICKTADSGAKGERYCQQLDAAGFSTPLDWQKREGCPKKYIDAWNHPKESERGKWRQRIADEKSKATAGNRRNAPAR